MLPGWLLGIVTIMQAVPSFVSFVEGLIAKIQNHPQGPAAGVAQVQAHFDTLPTPPAPAAA